MKTKVKKLFIPYLSLVLILSNFSFATTLAFCSMGGDNHSCACEKTNDTGKHGLAIGNVTKSCCETKIIELSNSNTLEILHSNPVNPIAHADLISRDVNNSYNISAQTGYINYNFEFHPPNSEIPIINSSLLI
jgi:hypothetical protein